MGSTHTAVILRRGIFLAALALGLVPARDLRAQTPARVAEFWENPSSIAADDNDTGGHPSMGLPSCDPPAGPLEGVVDSLVAAEVPTQGWVGGGIPGRLFWGGFTAGAGADANRRIIIDNWEDMSPSGFKNSFLLFENHNAASAGAAAGSYIYSHFNSDVTPAAISGGFLAAPKMIDLTGAGSRFLLGLNAQQILFADVGVQVSVRFLLQERGQSWYISDPVNSAQFNLFTAIGGGATFAGVDSDTLATAARLAGFRAHGIAGLVWRPVAASDGDDAQDVMNALDCGGPEAPILVSDAAVVPELTKITGMGLLLNQLASGNNTLFPPRLNGIMVMGMALEGRNPAQSFVKVTPETLTFNEGLDGAPNPSLNFVIEGWNTRLDGQSLFIDYATGAVGDTADGLGCDYVSVNTAGADSSLRLEFPPGYTRLERSIAIVNDRAHELASEFFTTTFTNPDPVGIELQGGTQVATILDTDPLPRLFIADTSILEGDPDGYPGGTQQVLMRFDVTIDRPSYLPLQADVSLAADNTIENCDYLTSTDPAVIMFEATPCLDPVPAKPLLVNIPGDLNDEPDQETFRAILGNLVNATPGDLEAVGTIDDNDPLPELVISPVSISEDGGIANFVLNLRDPRNPAGPPVESGKPISFDYATSPETARANCDYATDASSRLYEPSAFCGQTALNGTVIGIPILQDLFDEFDETFHVTLTNLVNAAPGAVDGIGTIADDDPLPRIELLDLTPEPALIGPVDHVAAAPEDGGQMTFAVQLKNPDGTLAQSEKPVTFTYATSVIPGTYSFCDYPVVSGLAGFQVLGACGESTNTVAVTVPVNIDAIDEVDEDMLIVFSNPVNAEFSFGQVGLPAAGVILDDDPEPFLVIADASTEEGISPLELAVSLVDGQGQPTVSGKEISFDFQAFTGLPIEGPALIDLDFEPSQNSVFISPSGECSLTTNPLYMVQVPIVDDNIYEFAEGFRVVLSNPLNSQLGDPVAVGTIEDDDLPPEISVEPPASPVGEVVSTRASFVPPVGNQAEFTIRLSLPSGRPVSAGYETVDGSAEAGGDYSGKKGFVNFFVNPVTGVTGTTASLTVPILDDFSFENDEDFALALDSDPDNATIAPGLGSASATIIDNDEPKLFLETWNLVDSQPRDYAAGPVIGADNPFEGFAGAATPFDAVRFAPVAGTDGSTARLQRIEFASGGSLFGNALKSPFPYSFYANQVTSITLAARVFFGAATPADAGTTGSLTNFTLALGDGSAGDFDEGGLPSLPGSLAGDASLAFEVNNDVLGAAGLKPRVRVAINNPLFLPDGVAPPFSATAELLPVGGGFPWNEPGVAGHEYLVSATFIQTGLAETIVQVVVEPQDGGGISTVGAAQVTLDAAFPFNRRINQIAALVGPNFGRDDGFPPTVYSAPGASIAAIALDGVTNSLTINGTNIGAVNVLANDSDSALRDQINLHVGATGVIASIDAFNHLVLTAADGRDITLTTTGTVADELGFAFANGDVTNLATPGGPPAFPGSWVDDICVRTLGFEGLPIARTVQWKRYE